MRILSDRRSFLFLVCSIWSTVHPRFCLEGSDCGMVSNQCHVCEGAACLRIFRPARLTTRGTPSVALTCLPHDSLIHSYNPDGCRTTMHGDTQCLCSHRDYCNSASHPPMITKISMLVSIPFALFVFDNR
ncbi:unnamed protein product, partial [Mesorhabditis belari]|uniref:Protein sleepless n=1 Tax=Mesorhabditis belari TaxID=2138241 RepID=A0AAF3F3B5_9BILA